jgi:hypothetical protein
MHRLLTKLLCALILFASLDRVPDPPVVKPNRDKASAVCARSPLVTKCFPDRDPVFAVQTAFSSLTSATLILDSCELISWNPSFPPYLKIWRASDTSPPPFRTL